MSDHAPAGTRQSAVMPSRTSKGRTCSSHPNGVDQRGDSAVGLGSELSFVQAPQTDRAVGVNVRLLSAHERTREACAP